jgi:hypothetical protein
MTTDTLRRDTKDASNELRHTAECARAGAVARGELPSVQADALERMADLARAGRLAESKAMHRREFESR